MDPVTTALIAGAGAAAASGATAGITEAAKKIVIDAYTGVKTLIVKRFGDKSKLTAAVNELEERPDSKSRQGVVEEEVQIAKADKDDAILKAAESLLEKMKTVPGMLQQIQSYTTTFGNNTAASGAYGSSVVNVNQSKS